MSAFEIISLIANLLFGTGFVMTLVTIRQQKRKAITEVQQGNVNLVSSSVTQMVEGVNMLMTQNKELINELSVQQKEKDELTRRIDSLERKVCSMIRTNREVIKALEKLNIEPHIIDMLKQDERCRD